MYSYFSTLNSKVFLKLRTTLSFCVTEYFKMRLELIWFPFLTLPLWFKYGLGTLNFQRSVGMKI